MTQILQKNHAQLGSKCFLKQYNNYRLRKHKVHTEKIIWTFDTYVYFNHASNQDFCCFWQTLQSREMWIVCLPSEILKSLVESFCKVELSLANSEDYSYQNPFLLLSIAFYQRTSFSHFLSLRMHDILLSPPAKNWILNHYYIAILQVRARMLIIIVLQTLMNRIWLEFASTMLI